MNLSKQIIHLRREFHLSQEDLAEKIYVSRQTISNWERGKTYPDIESLLLLSDTFDVSLDYLVKGDIKAMERKISNASMNKYANIMVIFSILSAISLGPSIAYLPGYWCVIPPLLLWAIGMYAVNRVDRIKKNENIKTYKEIVAYMENGDLEEVRMQRNKVKDALSLIFTVAVYVGIFILIALGSMYLFQR
ncbi:helix-turn-helix transcriptional regulator [Mammaliicoccus sp. Dog046]|uniref:helix-turn-helix domain-containing protein n=1 Tax=Mammaliicoccus sp. Dog046 TaxID=3034233 RepID=UPI002B263331|nr:helix-turn-helix transcriptional regulator [Mammaliicoccus sp. Dog046]WQK85389.1 helix-turn-helix transcriptional regulator [Mammaliicoccus sp. Dog046]